MICASLAGISFQECVKAMSKTVFAEIRIDQLDLGDSQFGALFAMKRKTIATCRAGKHDDKRRMALLKLAIEAGAGYVDIEYEAEPEYRKELIEFARQYQTIIIISYHNFDLTPSAAELESIIKQSLEWNADIVKIATMATSAVDCARIMALYEHHFNLVAFCMGKIGKITRVAAPLLGAVFTFAAINSKLATAPGQMTIDDFMDVYDIVK